MLLQPGLRVLRLDEDTVQLGTDPRWSLRITGVSDAMVGWLRAGAPDPLKARLSRADTVACEELLKVLVEAGLANDCSSTPAKGLSSIEAVASGLLFPAGEANDCALRRATAQVTIDGLCRTGLAIAIGLRAAGVAKLTLMDRTLVSVNDLGSGYRTSDISHPRSSSAARILNDLVPRVPRHVAPGNAETKASPDSEGPALRIVIRQGGISSPLRHELTGLSVPVLPVAGEANHGWLGPLHRPQVGPCLTCFDHYFHEADPFWPMVREQLPIADAPQTVPPTSVPSYLSPSSGLSGLLSAHTVTEALTHLDGFAAVSHSARIELRYPGTTPRVLCVEPHPNCGCDLSLAASRLSLNGRQSPPPSSVAQPV